MKNKEAKQEAIKKAYGRFYNEKHIRSDGSMSEVIWKHLEVDLEYDDFSTGYFRPKSLSGIDDNNGWTRIESEADLPKDNKDIFIIIDGDIHLYSEIISLRCSTESFGGEITHYQPIVKPKPPIF